MFYEVYLLFGDPQHHQFVKFYSWDDQCLIAVGMSLFGIFTFDFFLFTYRCNTIYINEHIVNILLAIASFGLECHTVYHGLSKGNTKFAIAADSPFSSYYRDQIFQRILVQSVHEEKGTTSYSPSDMVNTFSCVLATLIQWYLAIFLYSIDIPHLQMLRS